VALAYTEDSEWRNRSEFFAGHAAIVEFLRRKWNKELDYRLRKELWAFAGNRIAVRFEYEWHDDSGQWFRAHGNENREFDEHGLMRARADSVSSACSAGHSLAGCVFPGRKAIFHDGNSVFHEPNPIFHGSKSISHESKRIFHGANSVFHGRNFHFPRI